MCDATLTAKTADGVIAAAGYADAVMTRYIVENGTIRDDLLTKDQLKAWVDGLDPLTGQRRGRDLESPVADLILDATINAPKSFSIAAMLDPDIAAAYEDLQDRLRDRIIKLWQSELNARRGKGGAIRENLARIEVVELRHERSRSLDPHKHRHLWLNVKVKGQDGKWSNIDTRVALRFQNVVNAEGDLASRTDPAWINTLAAKGFTLNEDGEITQLQHLVRPLSKRSAQIEANKIARTAWWKKQHPGQEPSHDVLSQIDRWAWATGRPNKPSHLNEDDWPGLIRQELAIADPALQLHGPVEIAHSAVEDLDLELLAAKAVVDADARSTGTGGRFSVMDVRAGALRAIAASGVVASRNHLDAVATEVSAVAQRTLTVRMLSDSNVPDHVKGLMATNTATLKAVLAHRVEALSVTGTTMHPDEVRAIAGVVEPSRSLDDGQVDGATAIAGTSRTVAVSGAAGTGKTTMLKVSSAALRRQGRNMIIVAPTKKASDVAGRETQSAASSLHQLLFDYGWRWATAETGATAWTRLNVGDLDPVTGGTYAGPRIRIRPGDRIVVDEAGMLDLEAASSLVDVLTRTGAGVALVGDERQALPVGHSGAMTLFWRYAADQVELTTIHRYKDPEWADLTLRLRDPRNKDIAAGVADELVDTGHVLLTDSDVAAREAMIESWFDACRVGKSIALVTATHAEAQAVGEGIQARRIADGAIKTTRCVVGQSGQAIFVGDVVQTRRNDGSADVQNRQSWIVKKVTPEKVVLVSPTDSSDLRNISHDYAGSHLHLGYASTVYGVQGETTDLSLVGPGVDAAGLYVGLTRGRIDNSVVVVAPTEVSAKSQLVEMMQRGTIEETLQASRLAARIELNRAAQAKADSAHASVEDAGSSLPR
ncbi:MAG: AAA family ATPase [Leifsonia sp.]